MIRIGLMGKKYNVTDAQFKKLYGSLIEIFNKSFKGSYSVSPDETLNTPTGPAISNAEVNRLIEKYQAAEKEAENLDVYKNALLISNVNGRLKIWK